MPGITSLLTACVLGSLLTGCQQTPKGHDQLDAVLSPSSTKRSTSRPMPPRPTSCSLCIDRAQMGRQAPYDLGGRPPALIVDDAGQILTAGTAIGACQQAGSDKTCRRQWVDERVRVLLMVGDSDFSAAPNRLSAQRQVAAPYPAWFGQRGFLLPKPTYGGWHRAPYADRHALPAGEKRAFKQRAPSLP